MDTMTILYRNIKLRFNNLFTIFITILQPILWLVLYSTVAGETMKNTGIENYTAFILPGLIVLVIFATCSSSGMMNYIMKNNGSFYRILIAPVKRYSIVLGQILEGVLCSFFEVGIMILISLLFSIIIPLNLPSIISIILLIFMTAFFMASISYSISLTLPNEMIYETVMNAIVLPLFFLSSALFPTEEIRGLLSILVKLNPFTHVINALRFIILNGNINIKYIIFVLILLLVLSSISLLLAIKSLKSQTKL
ncbi:ABC transporter permease [Sporanaerobacter acetigenes]|uniref:Transport permease protein n=1 Tax=Sporanaerobacter acetigenes DSM 13106 TaxID=1123281 RepID=A0A1M5YGL0_9FIRM|nr:ABC transporter permease [Sporanaerobacter acetigenes]SHI11116.1 ABC-2 type transport system permease protein [Sporanaerobacter acetigenes DSM 13106]